MTLSVDVHWSFRSPYSYLATRRLAELRQRYDLEIVFRPVYPLAVRKADFFTSVNPAWVKYVQRDAPRLAEFLGLPFRWPKPDPIVQDMATLKIAEGQPYIRRLTRMGQAAADSGRGIEFAYEVSALLWGGTRGWNEGDHLRDAVLRAGLAIEELDAAIDADPEGYDTRIAANQNALEAAGHWGVPTMVFEGEPFFGQDRIDLLVWRLKQRGLAVRN
ncbi:DsbA family protein [Emcibacter sp. SYSU 3D8]|uniref:2-hydroxychromene-2-carboxylate isomerase n=1 Tax=Emcibacter sp. SYSU 3D8 TaxID=3133969 RepID=UPI0031FEBFCD